MRFNRLIIALLAAALMGFGTFGMGSAAQAKTDGGNAVAKEVQVKPQVDLRAKPRRDLNGKIIEPRNNKFFFRGNVNPGWSRKMVKIQYKNCKSCKWKLEGKDRTNVRGVYKERIKGKRSGKRYFRAVIRAKGPYARSVSSVWYIYSY